MAIFGFEIELSEEGLGMFESITDEDLENAKKYADSIDYLEVEE